MGQDFVISVILRKKWGHEDLFNTFAKSKVWLNPDMLVSRLFFCLSADLELRQINSKTKIKELIFSHATWLHHDPECHEGSDMKSFLISE